MRRINKMEYIDRKKNKKPVRRCKNSYWVMEE